MDKLSAEEISEFREIFNLVDKDGGGSITKVELADLMDTLGIDASPEEIDAMIFEIDQGKYINIALSIGMTPHIFDFPILQMVTATLTLRSS